MLYDINFSTKTKPKKLTLYKGYYIRTNSQGKREGVEYVYNNEIGKGVFNEREIKVTPL